MPRLLAAFVLSPVLWSQQPAEAPTPTPAPAPARAPAPTFRQRLDELFRGAAPPPAKIEVDGRIVEVAGLTRTSTDLKGEPDLHDQELVILSALTDELQRRQQMPKEETLARAFEAFCKPYDETPFRIEIVAKRFLGYPSLAAFEQRWRIQYAFEQTLGAIDTKTLQDEADRRRDFLGDGQLSAELWFWSARDAAAGRWDFAGAEQRARAGLVELRAGGDAEAVRKHSDPLPASPPTDKPTFYSSLREKLGESEYTDLITLSAADVIFYDAKPGELVGPLRGVRGYWVARVGKRVPAIRVLVQDERTKELVRVTYVRRRFLEWTDQVLSRSVLRAPAAAGR
jgi:hypothetical protein